MFWGGQINNFLTLAFILSIFFMGSYFVYGGSQKLTNAEEVYIAAESEIDVKERIKKWEELLISIDKDMQINPAISHRNIRLNLVSDYLELKQFDDALSIISQIIDTKYQAWALLTIIKSITENPDSFTQNAPLSQRLIEAIKLAKEIDNPIIRRKIFRKIVEIKARKLQNEKFINTIDGKKLEYNYDYVKSIIPKVDDPKIERMFYENNIYNQHWASSIGNAAFVEMQNEIAPEVIFIDRGVADLPSIYNYLITQGINDYLLRDGDVYTLRRPIIIGEFGSLIITQELRMSQDTGAYLVNSGKLFITDSKIIGWSEKSSAPAIAIYKNKSEFRPFITSLSKSKSYLAGSEFIALGYDNDKSYGLSFTAESNDLPHSQAIITDNSFNNLFYGLHSNNTEISTIIGNQFVDNIVYGIDLQDGSNNAIVAYNTIYDTQNKHGINVSNKAENSVIMGNIIFENKGSGVRIDNVSDNIIIHANTVFNNEQDGLTIFESNCKFIAANELTNNKKSAIRVRGSNDIDVFYNQLKDNKNAAISLQKASINIVGNHIENNDSGIFAEEESVIFAKDNEFINQSPKIARGKWLEETPNIFFEQKYLEQKPANNNCANYQIEVSYE